MKRDFYTICDVCGFKRLASQTKIRWDNLVVCKEDWETRHPLDTPRLPRNEATPNPKYIRPDDQLISIDDRYPDGVTFD